MARVTLRPATLADFHRLIGSPPAHRARAFSALIGETLLGVGGLLFFEDGTVWASAIITDEGRRYPAAIWRAGVHLMAMARGMGIRQVLAADDDTQPAAQRFLERLGFERRELAGETFFVWTQ